MTQFKRGRALPTSPYILVSPPLTAHYLLEECALVCLVRHSQTDCNLIKRLQGRENVPMNEVGHTQARNLSHFIEGTLQNGVSFSAVCTSPPSGELRCITEVSLFARCLSLLIDLYCFPIDPACGLSLVRFMRSHGTHIRQLVLPDRDGSSLGIQTIQLSKFMREKRSHHIIELEKDINTTSSENLSKKLINMSQSVKWQTKTGHGGGKKTTWHGNRWFIYQRSLPAFDRQASFLLDSRKKHLRFC